jgi:ribosomal protein S18 acetylase RimI-like enzyme
VLLLFPRLPTPALPPTREGYLLNVYTRPAWRGRGVASALVDAAVADARALGLARIRLHATAEGQPVYAAAGFRPRTDEMELRF